MTTAFLESNENFGPGNPEEPQMVMAITQGSADATANGITLTSQTYACNQPINLRVDDDPIQQLPGSTGGDCLKIAADTDLANRIIASKKVVVELDGAGGPQVTFNTEGLDLSIRR